MEEPAPKRKPKKNALETAAGLLAARAYTKLELRRKLYRKEVYPPFEIEQAVKKLESMGFLSDLRYCEDACAILRSRGYGPMRIRNRLIQKGVPREILDSVLTEPSSDPSGDALRVLEKNARRILAEKDLRKRHAKALRLLASRGFTADTVYQVVAQWEKQCEE